MFALRKQLVKKVERVLSNFQFNTAHLLSTIIVNHLYHHHGNLLNRQGVLDPDDDVTMMDLSVHISMFSVCEIYIFHIQFVDLVCPKYRALLQKEGRTLPRFPHTSLLGTNSYKPTNFGQI